MPGSVQSEHLLPNDTEKEVKYVDVELDFTDSDWKMIHDGCKREGMNVQEYLNYVIQLAIEAYR